MLGFLFFNKTKKEEHPLYNKDAFDEHLTTQYQIGESYSQRHEDPDAIEETIRLCLEDIKGAKEAKAAWIREDKKLGITKTMLPYHYGYKKLCIIYEKQKRFQEAVDLAKEAKRQGWQGDWDKRIKRCEGKLSKTNK